MNITPRLLSPLFKLAPSISCYTKFPSVTPPKRVPPPPSNPLQRSLVMEVRLHPPESPASPSQAVKVAIVNDGFAVGTARPAYLFAQVPYRIIGWPRMLYDCG